MTMLTKAAVAVLLLTSCAHRSTYPKVQTDARTYILVEFEPGKFMVYVQGFHSKVVPCPEGFVCTWPERPDEIYRMERTDAQRR